MTWEYLDSAWPGMGVGAVIATKWFTFVRAHKSFISEMHIWLTRMEQVLSPLLVMWGRWAEVSPGDSACDKASESQKVQCSDTFPLQPFPCISAIAASALGSSGSPYLFQHGGRSLIKSCKVRLCLVSFFLLTKSGTLAVPVRWKQSY